MNLGKFIPVLLAGFIVSLSPKAQTNKKMTDYLGVPGPVVFNKIPYNLSWSSHPSATYYKQEYLPAGEAPDQFKSMILLEFVSGNLNIKDVAGAKLAELRKMKETNPVVNFESFDNPKTGEYMIDFLVTADGADGKISIAERNVYRYKTISTGSGQRGILLFGVSSRSYGNAATAFIAALKGRRMELMNQVVQFSIPVLKPGGK